jgi:hypothetical protein
MDIFSLVRLKRKDIVLLFLSQASKEKIGLFQQLRSEAGRLAFLHP